MAIAGTPSHKNKKTEGSELSWAEAEEEAGDWVLGSLIGNSKARKKIKKRRQGDLSKDKAWCYVSQLRAERSVGERVRHRHRGPKRVVQAGHLTQVERVHPRHRGPKAARG